MTFLYNQLLSTHPFYGHEANNKDSNSKKLRKAKKKGLNPNLACNQKHGYLRLEIMRFS